MYLDSLAPESVNLTLPNLWGTCAYSRYCAVCAYIKQICLETCQCASQCAGVGDRRVARPYSLHAYEGM
jgi:hypothetical protein